MKSKASALLKQVVSLLVSIVKAKSAAVKTKTRALKTRLLIFGLLHNHKVLSVITHKISALVGHEKDDAAATAAFAMVQREAEGLETLQDLDAGGGGEAVEEEDDGYPDLRHSLFDDDDGSGSVVELVKSTRGENEGEFVLEDEIDHVAEVFIRRFHRQMRLQRLESLKRNQEMLQMTA
ncbi:unnamed protein product [Spirodela intermedia]|uniref:Uncharacterized protein n=1 Tax=Spirodela intermedia TaxID=51605 RepID=A0A7I8KST4_SPIIN|nr:unnamed protein product [Spirodela intermedia]